jgi:hypothetical protein
MQSPGKLDLECYAGATFHYTLIYKAGGVPVDLTNIQARMMVRVGYPSPDPVFSLTLGDGITINGPQGRIELFISPEDSAALGLTRRGDYRYDLELEALDGRVTRLVEGAFTVFPEVTRD